MRISISEMAKLSGVSVRTLHYYDEINLLNPCEVVSETGYRYYDEKNLEKLQQIMFYRELDFPLKEIVQIMNAPNYKKEEALARQSKLLKLKRKRLDKLIELIDANVKGDANMSFKEFDMTEIEEARNQYAKEVKSKWGETDAFAQSEKKANRYTKEDWKRVNGQMEDLLKEFSKHIGEKPDSKAVQELVGAWQLYITNTYYDCTKEILAGLGQMYVMDERFTKNMDKFGDGTADLMSQAIAIYCK